MPLNGKWIEIFKTGSHTNSAGDTKTWTTGDLDEIVSKYDPTCFEAPIVIGHPKTNAPAYGWVDTIKRGGTTLFAKLKQVMPEFSQAVMDGRYKNRSVSIHPKTGLRHIGWLGAQAPAVEGLSEVTFSDDDKESILMEFEETQQFRDIQKEALSMPKIEDLQKDIQEKDTKIAEFQKKITEQDAKIAEFQEKITKKDDESNKSKKDSAEFSEQQNKQLKESNARIATLEAESKKRDASDFCEQLRKDGKLAPAQFEQTVEFMCQLDNTVIHEFSEGDKTVKKTQLDQQKEMLLAAPKIIEFSEVATKEKAVKASANAKELAQKAQEFQAAEAKSGRTINLADAVTHIQQTL